MLSKALQNVGCITHHANGDANFLRVKTAVESAWTSSAVLVGDDTDYAYAIMLLKMAMTSTSDHNQRQTRELRTSYEKSQTC